MISVVIPAFNEEKLLPRCLKSLRHQDYQGDPEIIVVDNASTDGTARVAVEFGAKVITCSNKGVAYARQTGAQSASGDIIAQADADTVYPREWLSRIAGHFAAHQHSVALAGVYVYENAPPWARLEYLARYFLNIIGLVFLGRPVLISGANFAFRRQAFLKVNGYDPKSLYPDQWGICSRLNRVGRVSYDIHLVVSTSVRRVRKPFHSIIGDVVLNSARVLTYFVKHNANLIGRPAVRVSRLKTITKKAASIFLTNTISRL